MDAANETYAMPLSRGYLLIDSLKCAACDSCMMACSLAHEGVINLSLSRIQIKKNPMEPYPQAIKPYVCRQCPDAPCAEACPREAIYADPETGVRMIDEEKCIGCMLCAKACPFTPSRIIWNAEIKKVRKCDLCADTPYWDEQGGAFGKQACISVCQMKALKVVNELPEKYDINLRNIHYAIGGGLPIDDAGMKPAWDSVREYREMLAAAAAAEGEA